MNVIIKKKFPENGLTGKIIGCAMEVMPGRIYSRALFKSIKSHGFNKSATALIRNSYDKFG